MWHGYESQWMKGGLGEAVMHKRDIFTMGSPSDSTCSSLPHHVCGVMGKVQQDIKEDTLWLWMKSLIKG